MKGEQSLIEKLQDEIASSQSISDPFFPNQNMQWG